MYDVYMYYNFDTNCHQQNIHRKENSFLYFNLTNG